MTVIIFYLSIENVGFFLCLAVKIRFLEITPHSDLSHFQVKGCAEFCAQKKSEFTIVKIGIFCRI